MRDLMLQFSNNIFIEILMLAICADTLLGVLGPSSFDSSTVLWVSMELSERWPWLSV